MDFSRIYEKMVLVKTFVGETETGRFILKLLGLICDSEQSLNAKFKVKWESGIIIHVILKFFNLFADKPFSKLKRFILSLRHLGELL